jgi:hypothetical protein
VEAEAPADEPITEPESEPWVTIDVGSSSKAPKPQPVTNEIVAVDNPADLISVEPILTEPIALPGPENAPGDVLSLPVDIAERLQSPDSSQRAAALVDLADAGGEDSFELVTRCFDDPSAEVRNAAARALYTLNPDLAASFTRALREASPERRRNIGAAIAGSGLAANAINSLSGVGRDRTYDAFSILFLMAKAGEVQPLIQAISKHDNLEVRLTSVKLLALSNQPQILPNLRTLAGRDVLPPEVQKAVMEAIYLLSNQSREVA